MIDIRLFGRTRVQTPHRVLEFTDFGGAKPRHILEILCLRGGGPVATPALADLLWEGRPPRSWPATMYSYVALLRRVLQPGIPGRHTVVRTTEAGYRLDPRGVEVDLHRFDRLVDEAGGSPPAIALPLWQQACGLAARDLLEHESGVSWAVRARAEHRARVVDAALAGARTALDLGVPLVAADLARRATLADPQNEEGWQVLIEGLGRAGRHLDAARACRHRLREAGTEPDAHTLRSAVLAAGPQQAGRDR
ncbi:AfsR/SARP family transcriptional regulator [Pseudonocardia bannensis]|uniref:Response regulator receiver protein n=1 Tax=Pseudonocardia bannensis TaxID=630973 RepID=A0A848DCU2_9PSEU|nr:BTAD domain-containing putative transcriptional regulator [Pseudonocardia bannensis]NMH90429.1 response regulator receiver protein [Pseudonocardia bannensis]